MQSRPTTLKAKAQAIRDRLRAILKAKAQAIRDRLLAILKAKAQAIRDRLRAINEQLTECRPREFFGLAEAERQLRNKLTKLEDSEVA